MSDQLSTRKSLILRVRDTTDQEAWAEFVRMYQEPICGWARRRGLQDADAEEATGRTLLRLFKCLPKFNYDRQRGRFRDYLHKVLESAIAEMFREWRLIAAGTHDSNGQLILAITEDPHADSDLLSTLAKECDLETLRLAQNRARVRCQEEHVWQAYYLTEVEGKDSLEVAQILDIKITHVYAYRSRFKNYIREEFKKLDHEP